jgi:hypothetical protein
MSRLPRLPGPAARRTKDAGIWAACLWALAGCGRLEDQVTLEFATQSALEHTSAITVTAFEPILREPDEEEVSFVSCAEIGPFPPTRRVNPETITLSNLVGDVLAERESQTLPLEGGWSVSFPKPDIDEANNPWGAVMVFIEARGDARASERGAGQVAATLLSGCYCFRTLDGGPADPALRSLDQAVRKACPMVGEEGATGERVVTLAPVVPTEFHLRSCDGVDNLAAPRNGLLSPGPALCLDTTRCDDVLAPQDCFKCDQPSCLELDDKSNAPIVFTVEQPGGSAAPKSQVVLTDGEGRASASVQLDDCSEDVTLVAAVAGRTDEQVRFKIRCVDPIADGYECISERLLAAGFEAKSIARVPAEPGACTAGTPERCEQVAVLYENGVDALLEVRSPSLGTPVTVSFPSRRAHAVYGFAYDVNTGLRPTVVAVLADSSRRPILHAFEWRDGQLVPHDGVDGALAAGCGWLETCHRNTACTTGEQCTDDETCEAGRCRIKPCNPVVQPQSQVSVEARDLDLDGHADIAVGNSGELAIMFFYSSEAEAGAMYKSAGCACGRFGQAPNAFSLLNLGGPVPNPQVSDIVLGSAGGSFLKYAVPMAGRSELTCGQSSPLGDGMSVRDVRPASFRCRPDDLSCGAYEDAVVVSARGISGGSLDEPGFIRVLYGSSNDLSVGADVLDTPGISFGLVPTAFPDRGEPRDPRKASVADFNGDGHLDLAVLYKASEEVHVWLGASNGALGEVEEGPVLETCEASLVPGSRCAPLPTFATPDLDGDGRAEVAVICDPMGTQPRVRYYRVKGD